MLLIPPSQFRRSYRRLAPHPSIAIPQVIQTPFFVFNSKYDAWQLANELQTDWTTDAERAAVLQYGTDFLDAFAPVRSNAKNGAMITSCICHGCPWPELTLENRTSYQHYAAWAEGSDVGAAAIHIDSRQPNGGGKITSSSCKPFP